MSGPQFEQYVQKLLADWGYRVSRTRASGDLGRPADRQFYLWVLAQNTAAQAFYAACGGTSVETTLREPFPVGTRTAKTCSAYTLSVPECLSSAI